MRFTARARAIDDSLARSYISSRLLSASERAGSSVKDFVDVGNIADQMKSTPFWLVDLIEEAKLKVQEQDTDHI